MKITDILRRIALEDKLPSKWKISVAAQWIVKGATEPEETRWATMLYEDTEGGWRTFAELELSPNHGLHEYVDRVLVDNDAPASVVLPFLATFRHVGLSVELSGTPEPLVAF